MKTFEKIITILISSALFICLYLTGQSVLRTVSRYILDYYSQTTMQYSGDSFEASSAGRICGSALTWKFADGILIISGKGNIPNYKNSDAPWAALTITTVKIGEGVTGIGSHAFNCSKSLKHVLVPSTLTTIETDAFGHTERLPRIYVAYNNARFTSFSGVLFHKNGLYPVIYPSGKLHKAFVPFPSAMRQITSYIMYCLLYRHTIKRL